jgi:predicted PurR-regulated permease PerM
VKEGESRPDPPSSGARVAFVPTIATFAVIGALALFLYLVRHILLPFVIGAIVAYLLTPAVDWLTRRTHMPRSFWTVAVLGVLAAAVGLFGFLAGSALVHQVTYVAADLHGALSRLAREFMGNGSFTVAGQAVNAERVADHILGGLRDLVGRDQQILTAATVGFASLFGFILTWVITGYLLGDVRPLRHDLIWLITPRYRAFAEHVWVELDPILRRYFVGVALIVLYAASVAYVGLGLILGIHHAIFLALLTGILETVPLVGPAASAIVAGLVAVQQSTNSWGIVAYVIYAAALRISIDQFFGPIVLGKAARIRPVVVIFCFLTGGLLFGVVGIMLAVPVALAIRTTLAVLYQEGDTKRP